MNGNDLFAVLPAAAFSEPWLRCVDRMTLRLIEHAARNAPPALAERLQEEWLADLVARAGRLSRLRLAAGCCWAANVIAREYAVTSMAAAGPGKAASFALRRDGFLSRRSAAVLLIACLHLALIYFLAIGVATHGIQALPPPLVSMVREEKPDRPPAPLPPLPAKFSHPLLETIEPDIAIETPSSAGALQPLPVEPAKDPYTAAPPPRMDRVIGGPGKGFPNTADYYPDSARRLGEKGAAAVRVCVDAGGRLTSEPTLAQSSGYARLDAGALTLARAGSGHYRATVENGRPVSSCFPFRIRFEFGD